MSGNEESERLGNDRPMKKPGLQSGSVEDAHDGTVRNSDSDSDSDSDSTFVGSGPPGPLPVAVVDGGGGAVWHINDEKTLVIDLGDENGVQLEFLEDEGPEDEKFASAVEDGDERTAGRVGRGLGMEEEVADLRRVVAYIGIGISVGSESGISTPVLHYHEDDQLHTSGITSSGSLVPVPVLVRDEYGEDGTLRVREVSRF